MVETDKPSVQYNTIKWLADSLLLAMQYVTKL